MDGNGDTTDHLEVLKKETESCEAAWYAARPPSCSKLPCTLRVCCRGGIRV